MRLKTLTDFKLFQNYPNPFNSSTVIKFNLNVSSNVSFKIYDVNGREVDNIQSKYYNKGLNSFVYSPKEFSSGIYFLRIISNDKTKLIKILYLK